MKKLLLTVSFAILFAATTIASHLVGGYISYAHLGNNDYKVTMKLYRDCAGILLQDPAFICIHSTSLGFDTLLALTRDTVIVLTANTCVPQGLTSCQGGNGFGVEEHTYSANFHFDPAPDWSLGFADCCRNGAITTIQPDGFAITNHFDNSAGPNNTPTFNNPIFNEYCAGNFTLLDYSCYDIDGDSLVYRIDSCLNSPSIMCSDSAYISVTYLPGHDYINFLSSFTPITMNTSSGIISCLPSQLEIAVLSVMVDEYRNGVLIGSMKRDDEVVVSGGIQNPDSITGMVFLDHNNNQVLDSNDAPISGCVVQVQPGNIYATTDQSGNYSFTVIPGLYTINIVYPPPYTSVTPSIHSANFPTLGLVDALNDFAITPEPGIVDLQVTLTSFPVPPNHDVWYWINVKNIGTMVTSGTLEFTFDTLFSFISANPTNTSQAGQTVTWALPAVFWPMDSKTYSMILHLDSTAIVGDSVESSTIVYPSTPDTNFVDNTDYAIEPVILVPCDPNFKEVVPAGNVTQQFVQNGDWLEYTIFFQNVGTGPASHVKLMDGLDANLDIASFEKLGASHNCNYSISGPGLLKVNYWNINLESMFVNEPASHGFFKYRIRPKTLLVAGDQMLNAANIFFDSNAPVATNTTNTTVVNVTVIEEISNATIKAVFYPNPSNGVVNIQTDSKDLKLIITDISGKLLYNKKINGDTSFDMSSWAKGIYIYRLESGKGEYTAGKIIKQ